MRKDSSRYSLKKAARRTSSSSAAKLQAEVEQNIIQATRMRKNPFIACRFSQILRRMQLYAARSDRLHGDVFLIWLQSGWRCNMADETQYKRSEERRVGKEWKLQE